MSKQSEIGCNENANISPVKKRPTKSRTGRASQNPELSVKNILDRELKSRITIYEGGKTKKVTKLEALFKNVLAGALKGDPLMLRYAAELVIRIVPQLTEDDGETLHFRVTSSSQKLLDEFMRDAKSFERPPS